MDRGEEVVWCEEITRDVMSFFWKYSYLCVTSLLQKSDEGDTIGVFKKFVSSHQKVQG